MSVFERAFHNISNTPTEKLSFKRKIKKRDVIILLWVCDMGTIFYQRYMKAASFLSIMVYGAGWGQRRGVGGGIGGGGD